jgi:preprotein translocase subunit YajC
MTLPYLPYATLLQSTSSGPPGFLWPLQIVAIIGIFYFLLIRPQQKQKQRHELTLRQIKKGDEIVTSGGIVGKVVHIREGTGDDAAKRSLEDRVTIESGDSRLVVERGRIARIVNPPA